LSFFVIACVALLILSTLFCLYPRKSRSLAADELTLANLEWFQRRQAELAAEGNEGLSEDARLRLLEDEQQQANAETAALAARPFPAWIVAVVVALLSGVLYYNLGSASDVLINRQLNALDENSAPEDMEALVEAVERRSVQRPDNLHYTALLGRFYMGRQDYARAAATYGSLAKEAPEDSQALAYAAQAEYLARDRELTPAAQMLAERALAIDPHQRTALGLLGMAAFEQEQYRGAIEYWQRLLASEQPGSESARMIEGVINTARENLGEQPEPVAAETEMQVASAGVTVQVAFPADANFSPSDTVFVLARNANSDSRMPVAVKRLSAGQLPITIRLDDAASMAGQKLSELQSMVVVVQVSPQGQPGEANATYLGNAGPLAPTVDGETLLIELAPRP
jgi:cytochrome c-type biogenesis protein CcmH